jgi:hypothetical protein
MWRVGIVGAQPQIFLHASAIVQPLVSRFAIAPLVQTDSAPVPYTQCRLEGRLPLLPSRRQAQHLQYLIQRSW